MGNIVINNFTVDDVMNFENNLLISFFIKPFSYMTKKRQDKNLNMLRLKTIFHMK